MNQVTIAPGVNVVPVAKGTCEFGDFYHTNVNCDSGRFFQIGGGFLDTADQFQSYGDEDDMGSDFPALLSHLGVDSDSDEASRLLVAIRRASAELYRAGAFEDARVIS